MSINLFTTNAGGGGMSGVQTADNGLNLSTPTNVELGGPLAHNTIIDLSGSKSLEIADEGTQSVVFNITAGGASHAEISVTATGPVKAGILLTHALFEILDQINSRGLVNGGDYEANFIARSLVTKQYVDGQGDDFVKYTGVTPQLIDGVLNLGNSTTPGDGGLIVHTDNAVTSAANLDLQRAGTGVALNIHAPGSNANAIYIDAGSIDTQGVINSRNAINIIGTAFGDCMYFNQAAYGGPHWELDLQVNVGNDMIFKYSGSAQTQVVFTPSNHGDIYDGLNRRFLKEGDGNAPTIVDKVAVGGITASQNILSFSGTASNYGYRVNLAATYRTITGGSANVSVSYVDNAGAARTQTLTGNIVAVGPGAFPPLNLYIQLGSTISVDVVIAGTVIADFFAYIEQIA